MDDLTWNHGTRFSGWHIKEQPFLLLSPVPRKGRADPQPVHTHAFSPAEIEFNITGNYGSPVHVNHNANYSSMPSPDMDPADRRQPEQARRPLSVATDNMMLEFYKKDGYELVSLSQHWGLGAGGLRRVDRKAALTGSGVSDPWPLACPLTLPASICASRGPRLASCSLGQR